MVIVDTSLTLYKFMVKLFCAAKEHKPMEQPVSGPLTIQFTAFKWPSLNNPKRVFEETKVGLL